MKTRGRPRYPDVLTPRQQDVLRELQRGLTNEEIAERLGISPDGVKFHVSEILARLGVSSRYEAAAWRPEPQPARRGWGLALAPFALLYKIKWNAATSAIAGVAAIALAAGIALLAWGVVRTRGRSGTPAVRIGAAHPEQVIFTTLAAGEQPSQHSKWTVTVYDTAARRIAHQFDIGDGVNDQPAQVVAAGDRLVANLSDRIVRYDLDGSNATELLRVPNFGIEFSYPHVIGIGASPEGAKIALAEQTEPGCPTAVPGTEATPTICSDYPSITRVAVIDARDGKELLSVPQTDPRFAGYHGQAALPAWRADGRSFTVESYTYSEAPGSVALVSLNGNVRVLDSNELLGLSPGGTYAARGASRGTCGLGGVNDQHEIRIQRLDDGTVVARVSDEAHSISMREWAPDSSALLYRSVTLVDNPATPGCKGEDATSERWYLLPTDGAPPVPVADQYTAERAWYGDRAIVYRCGDASLPEASCTNPDGTNGTASMLIGGVPVVDTRFGVNIVQQIAPG